MLPRAYARVFLTLTTAFLPGVPPAIAQSGGAQSAPEAHAPKLDPRKARQLEALAQRAEQAEDWDAALDAYTEATRYAPGDRELQMRRETMRFRIVQRYTDRAERDALAGRLDLARAELHAALKLDPGYSVARERLAQFETGALEQKEDLPLAQPAQVAPQAGTHEFDHRGDIRTAYQAIAAAFSVVAAFDAELPARPVRFRTPAVDFPTAMDLLARETNTFWRAVDAHTFFVAENTEPKRREYAPEVVRTFILPASTTPDRMTETLRLVREIAGIAHTEIDTRTRTLTLRDTPQNVALAAALIEEIEQARGELMLEIEILEVDQTVARRLGITPPSTSRVVTLTSQQIREAQQSAQGLLNVINQLFGTSSAVAGLSSSQILALFNSGQIGLAQLLPPVVAFGGGRTTFLAPLPGAAADFKETFSLVRSGRRVLLRAQDGQPASFFVGDRFPITLALLGPGFVTSINVPGVGAGQLPRSDINVGRAPVAILTADFNGDKFRDVVVANRDSNTVSILLGNGDGTFTAKPDLTGFTAPVALAAADFNGDGKLDLAVVNRDANSVTILLGNGDGTFTDGGDLVGFSTPVAIAAADFDGDGKLDLAVVNQGNNTVAILQGDGDGTFTAKPSLPVGAAPAAIVIGDFNGDGKPDFAVVNRDDSTVSLLLNSGGFLFTAAAALATGAVPVALATGDFNADSFLDLVVANRDANTISIFLGKGDGTFSTRNDVNTGSKPLGVATGDFNIDGRLDVLVANSGSNTISVLLGQGDGTIGARLDVRTGALPVALSVADLNGDARSDAVIADQGAGTITVILNTATFSPPPGAGSQQTPFPGSEYVDLGLKVRATPRLHADNEVTLQLEFEIRSLSGAAVNGIPILSNRTLQQTVRLRADEASLISGIISRDETRALSGLPGFAYALGHLASRRDTNLNDTELFIFITPRQLRLAPHTNRSIYAGRGDAASTTRTPPP